MTPAEVRYGDGSVGADSLIGAQSFDHPRGREDHVFVAHTYCISARFFMVSPAPSNSPASPVHKTTAGAVRWGGGVRHKGVSNDPSH